MLLIDDLLFAPFRGLLWVVEKVHDVAQEEMAGEAEAITEELRQLYMMLESGQITEMQFDEQEQTLLDRLDAIQARGSDASEADEDEDSAEDDEEEPILGTSEDGQEDE